MVRCALPCLVLVLAALAACGGGAKLSVGYPEAKACQSTLPEAAPWDGKPAQPGSVIVIEPAPDGSQSPTHDGAPPWVAYEIDPKARTVRRPVSGNPEDVLQFGTQAITNPRDNAGTLSIIRNPPPPPDPPIHLGALIGLAVRASQPGPMAPCQQK